MTKTIALPSPHFLLECAMFVQTSFKTNKNLIKYHGLKQLFETGVFSQSTGFLQFPWAFPFSLAYSDPWLYQHLSVRNAEVESNE